MNRRELSAISRNATFRAMLRTGDSSCWYRRLKLRPPLCVGFSLDWVEDVEVRLECVGSRCGGHVVAERPSGKAIRRQKLRCVDYNKIDDFSSADNWHDRVSLGLISPALLPVVYSLACRLLSCPPSTLIAAFLDTLLGRAPKWVNRCAPCLARLIAP